MSRRNRGRGISSIEMGQERARKGGNRIGAKTRDIDTAVAGHVDSVPFMQLRHRRR